MVSKYKISGPYSLHPTAPFVLQYTPVLPVTAQSIAGGGLREVYNNDGRSCLCCDWSRPWPGNVLRQALGQRGLQGLPAKQFSTFTIGFYPKVAMVSRTASKLEAAAAENPGTFAFAADVTNPASLKAALTEVEQKLGEIHTVVYNAGLGVWATYENVTHEKLEMSMKTNVHGLLTVAQHVGPKMTARGEGVIAVTGATAALRGKPMTVSPANLK